MKSLATIHQQAIRLLSHVAGNHTRAERIVQTHNRYVANICASFGIIHPYTLTYKQHHTAVSPDIYTL